MVDLMTILDELGDLSAVNYLENLPLGEVKHSSLTANVGSVAMQVSDVANVVNKVLNRAEAIRKGECSPCRTFMTMRSGCLDDPTCCGAQRTINQLLTKKLIDDAIAKSGKTPAARPAAVSASAAAASAAAPPAAV
jgi:hypothetical protein